jgi:hypothetical protein
VAGYRVYRDGAFLGTTTGTTYADGGGSKRAASPTYHVVAYDGAGNLSPPSNAASLG